MFISSSLVRPSPWYNTVKQVRDENECHADNNLNEAALALCMCLGICINIWFIVVVGSANVLRLRCGLKWLSVWWWH